MEFDPTPFTRYVAARQAATDARRAGQPRPWSSDAIIAEKKFCSVRRDDDRGSVEARDLILALPERLRLGACLGFRLYNRPSTLRELIAAGLMEERSISGHERFREVFAAIEARDEPILSNAYKIQVVGGLKNLDTIARMVHKGVRSALSGEFELRRHSGMYTCHGVRGAVGSGGFVCYQTMQDLRWLQEPGFKYKDQDSWALIGIGAIRGLSRLLGVYGPDQKWRRPAGMGEGEFRQRTNLLDTLTGIRKRSDIPEMPSGAALLFKQVLDDCWGAGLAYMDMFEVEHNCCEFDKYERIRTGESKGATFTPRGATGEAESGASAGRGRGRPRRVAATDDGSESSSALETELAAEAAALPDVPDDADEFVA